jgi:hypothetical protein
VIQRGDSVYRAVLADAAEPTAAVAEFLRTINVAVGEPPNEQ